MTDNCIVLIYFLMGCLRLNIILPTSFSSLLLLNLIQSAQQGINFCFNLHQFLFDCLQLIWFYCWDKEKENNCKNNNTSLLVFLLWEPNFYYLKFIQLCEAAEFFLTKAPSSVSEPPPRPTWLMLFCFKAWIQFLLCWSFILKFLVYCKRVFLTISRAAFVSQ